MKDELTLMVSEKTRVSCICTSSSVLLLIPAMPTPLLPKDPTASTILANLNELLCCAFSVFQVPSLIPEPKGR